MQWDSVCVCVYVCVCVCVCVLGVGVLLHLRSQFYGGPWSYNKDLHYNKYIVRMYTSYRLNKYHQIQIYLKGYLIKRLFLVNIHFLNGETPRIQPVCEKSTIILSQKEILRLRTMFYHQDFTAPNVKLFLLLLLSLVLFSASEPSQLALLLSSQTAEPWLRAPPGPRLLSGCVLARR